MSTNDAFTHEYVGTFLESTPAHRAAFLLWCRYYVACEAYDRTVCTGPIRDGSIWPATSEEHRLIAAHANERRREREAAAREQGIDDATNRAAKLDAVRLSFEDAQRTLAEPPCS